MQVVGGVDEAVRVLGQLSDVTLVTRRHCCRCSPLSDVEDVTPSTRHGVDAPNTRRNDAASRRYRRRPRSRTDLARQRQRLSSIDELIAAVHAHVVLRCLLS